ncbi:MAG TPA: DNA translocase FtsK 4TM domain-containing protein, partial [Acidobacteriaceae bacterium]|nr:DNA translocase FtsK 4TM domain-containing protein [Acidobacteriaceae bacterium]
MKSQRLSYAPTRSRRLNEICGLLVLAAAVLLLLALISYNPADPSLDTVGGGTAVASHPTHNWTGLSGAYFADLVLQFLGVAALLGPLVLGRVGVSWMRSRRVGAGGVKLTGLLLWLVFAPAGVALLPGHLLFRGALPLSGVEGRLLADTLVHLLNAPGALIFTGLMMAISLYLATSFAFGSAPEWFNGHFAFLRSSREQIALWRFRKAHPEEEVVRESIPAAFDPESAASAEHAEKHSLLSGLLRLFGRKRTLPAVDPEPGLHHTPEQVSLWDAMPRTDVDAPHLEGLAAANAAAAPFAAQLAAAATPLRASQTEPEIPLEGFQPTGEDPQPSVLTREEDDWLNSPDRQSFTPILSRAAEAAAAKAAATGAGPQLVRRAAATPSPEPIPHPVPAPFPDPVPAPEPPAPVPPAMRERAAAAAPARPTAPAPRPPSPTADIRDQNVQFGERADAHQLRGFQPVKSIRGYQLPPATLLHASEGHAVVREDALRAEAQVLVEKCAEFGVSG